MKEMKLQPRLRFPEFEGEWKSILFNQLYSIKPTNSYSRECLNYKHGNIKNIHYGDIHTKFNSLFDITKERVPYINMDTDISKIQIDNYLKEGDLIIADASENYADIGKSIEIINLNDENVVAGLHTILARKESSEIQLGFMSFLMKTNKIRNDIKRIAQGTKVLGISAKRVSNISLDIPLPEEQKKIASFLTYVDKYIDLLIQKKKKLELYKKSVMQQIFNKEIRFKDEGGSNFPKWEDKKLEDIGSTYNGLTGKSKEDFGSGKPYIQYMQIFSNSKIDINQFGLVNINENDSQNKAQKGDVFFTTSSETPNEIGTASVLLEDLEEVYLNSFCFGFRPNSIDELLPEFAQFLFRSSNVRKKIIQLAQGSTRYNMSKVEFMQQSILLPVPEEQRKIASFLSALDKQMEGVSIQIDSIKNWKKGLLQQMFV